MTRLLLSLPVVLMFGEYGHAQSRVSIDFNSTGLSSLKYNGVEYLAFGDFRLDQVSFQTSSGSSFEGDLTATTSVDAVRRRLSRTSAWGTIIVDYRAVGNRLYLTVRIHNRSADVLRGVWFEPLGLQFPSRLREYDGKTPLITHTLDQPALVRASYDSGVVVLASEDGAKPVLIGFPWALDRPKNTVFPISLNSLRVAYLPTSYPTIRRPIPPQGTDSFSFSLRFGSPGSTKTALAEDIYRKFAAGSPALSQWADRRAIGALFLSTAAAGWTTNPRGWLQDPKIDVTSGSGIAEFRKRILAYADGSIAILRKMNAQGMITWDIEGQQYPHATSYIGDPRLYETLAPEMKGIADEYFDRFREAGLRVGVCIRPQRAVLGADGRGLSQMPVDDPAELLIDKVQYARNRWGATIFYVDSNVNGDDLNPIDASVFKKLAIKFPDVLFVPEHSRTRYYAYAAPYRELRQGHASTEADIRFVYPSSFSVIYTADGPIDKRYQDLLLGVKHGDVLLFRGWFDDPQNVKDREIYQKAHEIVPPNVVISPFQR